MNGHLWLMVVKYVKSEQEDKLNVCGYLDQSLQISRGSVA